MFHTVSFQQSIPLDHQDQGLQVRTWRLADDPEEEVREGAGAAAVDLCGQWALLGCL